MYVMRLRAESPFFGRNADQERVVCPARGIAVDLPRVCIVGGFVAPDVHGQDSTEQLLERAEVRLRAIYKTGEYSGEARSFRGAWLPDGSGYTVTESDPASGERMRVSYDAATGKRTVLGQGRRGEEARGRRSRRDNTSPDGRLIRRTLSHLDEVRPGYTFE